ncbi:V-set domain-containing T-cell activation inhibitor 1-like [Fundulus diaphanus]
MEFILLLTCFLMFSGTTVVDGNGPFKITAKEDKDVILPCSFGIPLTDKHIQWIKDNKEIYSVENGHSSQDQQFRQRVSHFADELKFGNASIKINEAKRSDSGIYDCKYRNQGERLPLGLKQINLTVEWILKDRSEVHKSGYSLNQAAIPSVRTVYQTDDGALLRCKVLGATPKLTLVWFDSAGNNVSNKAPQITDKGNNRYDVILETTVTKTDNYTCVATQEEIDHPFNETTFVNARGKGISVTPSLVLIGITIGVLTGV